MSSETLEYSNNVLGELRAAAAESKLFRDDINVTVRILYVGLAVIRVNPSAGSQVAERPGVYVLPLFGCPYKIFYRPIEDKRKILHIRRTARGPYKTYRRY